MRMEPLEELLPIGWAAEQHRGEARWKGDLVDEYVQIGQGGLAAMVVAFADRE